MTNRVIKDSIWTSPSLANLDDFIQDQFPRWLLMADDWGCFNADPDVVKGLVYPKRKKVTISVIESIVSAFYDAGILFFWSEPDGREWGYWVSWDDHHSFCNKTAVDNGGKQARHRRKTPEPPKDLLNKYLSDHKNKLEQLRTSQNKYRNPNPNPNPNPIPNPKKSSRKKTTSDNTHFEKIWEQYPSKVGKKDAYRHYIGTVKTEIDQKNIGTALDNYITHVEFKRVNGFSELQWKNAKTWFGVWQDWIIPPEALARASPIETLTSLTEKRDSLKELIDSGSIYADDYRKQVEEIEDKIATLVQKIPAKRRRQETESPGA